MNGYNPSASSDDDRTPNDPQSGTGNSFKVLQLWQSHLLDGRITWLTSPPKPAHEPTNHDEPEYAITLHHRAATPSHPYHLDSIIIRSPSLQALLSNTIPNIAALYDEVEQGLVFQSPFRHLFWHLDAIETAAAASDTSNSNDGSNDLAHSSQLLLDILHTEFSPFVARRKTMLASGAVNFDTLWTIYRPGMTCITFFLDKPVAVRLKAVDYGRHAMGGMYHRFQYEGLVWNGECLGWRERYVDVMEYKGRRGVGTLPIVPVEFWEGEWKGMGELMERGRRMLDIVAREPCMMRFSGETLDREAPVGHWWDKESKERMSERVVLDARGFGHYFRRLAEVRRWKVREEFGGVGEEELIFVFPELHAFALKHKKWTRLWIDDVQEVVFNERAYPSLVLPSDYKQLLLAFAEAHMEGYGGFDDVIAGKGQGILMLLAGPPGTGKTLTAEAMSEHMKRPLYSVSTGELGMGTTGMEHELNKVLELCTRWNAVLLLDEADVFLEKRADNDIQRNSIVSVFLRRLEYYRGIMFLTTNRIRSFDEAFRSRIHVAIQYPDLDAKARRSIWANFLHSAGETYQHGVETSDAEIDELAETRTVNGREIRNLVKSAQLLASRAREPLRKQHIETVWRVEMENSPWKQASGE